MKKRTIQCFSHPSGLSAPVGWLPEQRQEPRAEWDQEAGILTVDGVHYRKDETLVSIGDGLHRWRYAYIFGDDPAKRCRCARSL